MLRSSWNLELHATALDKSSAVDANWGAALQVILTVRDPEKWYESYVNSLLWLYQTWWFKPFACVLPMGIKLQVFPPCPQFSKRAASHVLETY
jgi:hypothetical protein